MGPGTGFTWRGLHTRPSDMIQHRREGFPGLDIVPTHPGSPNDVRCVVDAVSNTSSRPSCDRDVILRCRDNGTSTSCCGTRKLNRHLEGHIVCIDVVGVARCSSPTAHFMSGDNV